MNGIAEFVITQEFKDFEELENLIKYELSPFSEWENDIKHREEELKKTQEELNKKGINSSYEAFIEDADITDFLNEDDENNIYFQKSVLQMLLCKIYTKCEILIKTFYVQVTSKRISFTYNDWVQNYKDDLGIDFSTLVNYQDFQKLRIFNNVIKHSDGIIGEKSAKDIFRYSMTEILRGLISDENLEHLKAETDESQYAKYLSLIGIDLKNYLTEELINNLYNSAKNFIRDLKDKL